MKYSIGQVLYVLMNRETKICPVQVIEEITKKTLNGETTNYVVRFGQKGETMSLLDMDGQVFESVETLRQILHEKVIKTIDIVIANSEKRATQWYSSSEESSLQFHGDVEQKVSDDDDTMIVLPDGTKAKVKLPISGV